MGEVYPGGKESGVKQYLWALIVASAAIAQTVVQISPASFQLDDDDVGLSRTLSFASPQSGLPLDLAVDGGSATAAAPNWIRVSPLAVVTPGRVTVTVLSRPGVGTFTARILVRSRTQPPATLATVNVTLTIRNRTAAFRVEPGTLNFHGQVGALFPAQILTLNGASCAQVKISVSAPWITVTPEAGRECTRFLVTVRPPTTPGGLWGTIRLEAGTEVQDVIVSLFLSGRGAILGVNPEGLQFESRLGAGNSIPRNLAVRNLGDGTLNWTARVLDPPNITWLQLGATSGTASQATEGRIPVTVNPAGLAEGIHYALVAITSAGSRGSPQLVTVAHEVAAAARAAAGTPSPSGMIFALREGSPMSPPQVLTVFTSSTTAAGFSATPVTFDGAGWLLVQGSTGTTSTATPGRANVLVNPVRLPAGIYRGEVVTHVNGSPPGDIRAVNVTMIVQPPPPPQPPPLGDAPAFGPRHLDGCTRALLVPTHTGLVNNFQTRAGWPTPLNLRVWDNCGEPVTDANAVLSFSNGDPPLTLTNVNGGNYAGTWTPRGDAVTGMSIRAAVSAATLTASLDLLGTVAANANPVVTANGVVNNFDRRAGGALAPQTLVEIYGESLAGGTAVAALQGGRLPDTVNDVTVFAGTTRAPLYAISPGQLNGQIPDSGVDQQIPLVVKSGNRLSSPVKISLMAQQPGIAAFPDGRIIAQDTGFRLITNENRARRGNIIITYLVGMGATTPAVQAGAIAPANPLARVDMLPEVTIGGRRANVQFAGLTPGLVGLYQINMEIPADLTPGNHQIEVRQGSVQANTVTVPVE